MDSTAATDDARSPSTRPRSASAAATGRDGDRRPSAGTALSLVDPTGPPPREADPGDDRVALVAGGTHGLGLTLAAALVRRGMRVVIATRTVDQGRAALDTLGPLADHAAVRQLDVTDAASVRRLVAWLHATLGRCDALMNNVAVLRGDDDSAYGVDLDVVRDSLETNVVGSWRLSQAIAPLMRKRRYGRIVNISSSVPDGPGTTRGMSAYRTSQTALRTLTRILANELYDDGILVNAYSPVVSVVDASAEPSATSPSTAVWLATLPSDGPTGGAFR